MESDIKSLIDLQTIDLQVKSLDEKINDGRAEAETRRTAIDEKKRKIAGLQDNLQAGEKRRRELEAEIEDETARIKDRQTKLMNVQTNREYQGLLKEIEDGKKANSQREDETVLLMEQNEIFKSRLEELNRVAEEEEKILRESEEKLEKQTADISKKREEILISREKTAKKVPASLLGKYEKLRSRRNGIAISGVTNAICRGCNMNIPPQLFNDLLRNEKLLSCPTCNRMIFHQVEESTE